jgi:hypothetical protein
MFKPNESSEIALRKRGIGLNRKKDETTDPKRPLIITTALLDNDAMG